MYGNHKVSRNRNSRCLFKNVYGYKTNYYTSVKLKSYYLNNTANGKLF